MRAVNPKLLRSIKEDQAANGELVRNLARLLKIPVVILGGKNDAIFRSFRETLEVGGMPTHTISFDNHMVRQAVQTVPRCSRYGCLRHMTGDDSWNARIDSFLSRYCHIENIQTAKGNISEKILRAKADRSLWCAYFTNVILGAVDEGEGSGRNRPDLIAGRTVAVLLAAVVAAFGQTVALFATIVSLAFCSPGPAPPGRAPARRLRPPQVRCSPPRCATAHPCTG